MGQGTVYDAFLAQYDSSGNQVWIRQFNETSYHQSDYSINGIAVDSSSNSYVIVGGNVLKYDKFGNRLWIIGTTGGANAITVGSSGNVYVTGSAGGGLPDTSYGNSRGGSDAWIDKYDTNGTLLYGKSFGTASNDYSNGITVDSQDNAYVTGYTQGGSLDGKNIGGADAFVAKYDTNGNQVSLQQFGTPIDDKSQGIVYSKTTGNLYLTGTTTGNLGGNNVGGIDTWVAKDGPASTNDVVYRFYNSRTQQHFYTANTSERDLIMKTPSIGYAFEGGAFGASLSTGSGLVSLYRFYAGASDDHFYTTNESEKNSLISNTKSGYQFEGVAFYVYGASSNVASSINRYYNAKIGQHLFTGNTSEIAGLSKDWVSEGVAFKAAL